MERFYLVGRWSLAFTVLAVFTFFSIANLTRNSSKVFAAEYSNLDPSMRGSGHYIALEDENSGNRFENKKTVCAMSQQQFDRAVALYNARAVNVQVEGSDVVTLAKIAKTNHINANQVIRELNLTPAHCRAITTSKAFYFYLLPGVS